MTGIWPSPIKQKKLTFPKKKKKAKSPSPPSISLPPSLSLSLKIVIIKNTKSKQKTIYKIKQAGSKRGGGGDEIEILLPTMQASWNVKSDRELQIKGNKQQEKRTKFYFCYEMIRKPEVKIPGS